MSYQSIPDFAEQEDTQAVFDLPSSLKAQFFRRIPIFVAVLLFLTAVAGTRHSPTTSSMTSFAATSLPELRADCLSRDYGPVKEGYDLVKNSYIRIHSTLLIECCINIKTYLQIQWTSCRLLINLSSQAPMSLVLRVTRFAIPHTKDISYGSHRHQTRKFLTQIHQNICQM